MTISQTIVYIHTTTNLSVIYQVHPSGKYIPAVILLINI